MLDDILFVEGEREEMVLELPVGDDLEPPDDILTDTYAEYEIPGLEYNGVFF